MSDGPTGRDSFVVQAAEDERGVRVAPYCLRCDAEVQPSTLEVFSALSLRDLDGLADHHNLKVHGEEPEP